VRILFDQGTPVPLRKSLTGHAVSTAYEMGWATLQNGDLLQAAEAQFEVLVTTDQNLRSQQNLAGRHLAILVLPFASWPRLQSHVLKIASTLDVMKPGDYVELALP
jgi:predicted nuclease of predicted toxin-antitoxin system